MESGVNDCSFVRGRLVGNGGLDWETYVAGAVVLHLHEASDRFDRYAC